MKNITVLFLIFLSINGFCQKLKTINTSIEYDGYFMGQPVGEATFTCYEDENMNDIRHGKFNFSYSATADINEAFIDEKQKRNFTASGSYKNGLKDGTWIFSMVDKNVFDGYKYYSGTLKLTANFKDGKPNGSWVFTETWNSKVVKSYNLVSSGKPQISRSINANFKMGTLTGNLNYSTSEDNTKISISFDEFGYVTSFDDESDTYKDLNYYENHFWIKNINKNKATGKAITEDYSKEIEDYKIHPEKYFLDTLEMSFFQKYFWDRFTKPEFNFKNWDNYFPEFNGGYYLVVKNMPSKSIAEIINDDEKNGRYGLSKLFTELKTNGPTITVRANEETCLNYLTYFEKLKPILLEEPGYLIYNSGKKYLITDFESDIVVLDTLINLINKKYNDLQNKRIEKDKLEKELQDQIKNNSELLDIFINSHEFITSKCLTLKENSPTDQSVISPNRCISSKKAYNGTYNCLMINKKQMNIWAAYSLIVQNNEYIKKFYRIETLEKELNGYVYGAERQNKEKELDNLKKPKSMAVATEDNNNLTSIINLQKKLTEIFNDEKLTKSLNKKLKDISDIEQIKKIILQPE